MLTVPAAEVRRVTWDEVDVHRGLWTVPSASRRSRDDETTGSKSFPWAGAAHGCRHFDEGAAPAPSKARVTVLLDQEVAAILGERASETGRAFQTVLNQALREYLAIKSLDAI